MTMKYRIITLSLCILLALVSYHAKANVTYSKPHTEEVRNNRPVKKKKKLAKKNRMAKPQKVHSTGKNMALTSMILSSLGFLLFALFLGRPWTEFILAGFGVPLAIFGLIMGLVSRKKIEEDNSGGKGFSLAAIIMGGSVVLVTLVGIIIVIAFLQHRLP